MSDLCYAIYFMFCLLPSPLITHTMVIAAFSTACAIACLIASVSAICYFMLLILFDACLHFYSFYFWHYIMLLNWYEDKSNGTLVYIFIACLWMCPCTVYTLAYMHTIALRGCGLKGYVHMTTLIGLFYTWLLDIYIIFNIQRYNY